MYPSYTAERLIVVTTLLEETVEKWTEIDFMHMCSDNMQIRINVQLKPFRSAKNSEECHMCEDFSKIVYYKSLVSMNQVRTATSRSRSRFSWQRAPKLGAVMAVIDRSSR